MFVFQLMSSAISAWCFSYYTFALTSLRLLILFCLYVVCCAKSFFVLCNVVTFFSMLVRFACTILLSSSSKPSSTMTSWRVRLISMSSSVGRCSQDVWGACWRLGRLVLGWQTQVLFFLRVPRSLPRGYVVLFFLCINHDKFRWNGWHQCCLSLV